MPLESVHWTRSKIRKREHEHPFYLQRIQVESFDCKCFRLDFKSANHKPSVPRGDHLFIVHESSVLIKLENLVTLMARADRDFAGVPMALPS